MGTWMQILAGGLFLLSLLSCSEMENGLLVSEPADGTGENAVGMDVYMPMDFDDRVAGIPVFTCMDGISIASIYNPENAQSTGTMMCLFENDQWCTMVSFKEDSFLACRIDPDSGTAYEDFFAANADCMVSGKMDWATGLVSDTEWFSLEGTSAGSGSSQKVQKKDASAGFVYGKLAEIMEKVAGVYEGADVAASVMPSRYVGGAGIAASWEGSIWEVMAMHLREAEAKAYGDYDRLEVLQEKREQAGAWYFVKKLIPSSMTHVASIVGERWGNTFRNWFPGETPTQEEISGFSSAFSNVSYRNLPYSPVYDANAQNGHFAMAASVSGVTRNSAKVSGSYKWDGEGANIFEKGILWCPENGNLRDGNAIKVSSETDHWTVAIEGLEPGTTYKTCSYLTSTSGNCYSATQYFTTKGLACSAQPESFSFGADGGSATATISRTEGSKVEVVSKPAWCTASISGNLLNVSARNNKDEQSRKGDVVVRVFISYEDGTKEEQNLSIPVFQEGKEIIDPTIVSAAGLANTKWNVEGTYSVTFRTSEGIEHYTYSISQTIAFGNMGNGVVIFEGIDIPNEEMPDIGKEINLEEIGFSIDKMSGNTLEMTYSATEYGLSLKETCRFVRTSTDTLEVEIEGSVHESDGSGLDFSFKGTGKLVR